MSYANRAFYYYPTTVILIDDSEGYLTTVTMTLNTDINFITFNNATDAINYLKKCESYSKEVPTAIVENFQSDTYGSLPSETDFKTNISKLFTQVYNKNRFKENSVVIMDDEMPGMTGTELCHFLKDHPIKKIMLTGEADDKKARQLLAKNLIDDFISKSSTNVSQEINEAIITQQERYFAEKSIPISILLPIQSNSILNDPIFFKTFKKICDQNDIVEYYLIDVSGSFLMLRADGTPMWFLIATEQQLSDYYEVGLDQKADKSILKLIKDGKKLPYFRNNEELFNAKDTRWDPYMYPATKVTGEQTFYYSLVKDKTVFDINNGKISSYQHHSENEWPPSK